MIEVANISKRFGAHQALEDITLTVADGMVYGLVGYNGAGKTTLLKIIAGVYKPDAGEVHIDGVPMHSDRVSHDSLFIVADEPYFLPQATPETMHSFYRGYYPHWSDDVYERMLALFGLDPLAKVTGFSKGMQRQLGILLGFATGVKTMLLDESFDGLDLGKRNLLKRLLKAYAHERGASVILSSHNLRELEDAADHLGMIKGCRLTFDGSVASVHEQYPGSSLEEIFLSEGGNKVEDIHGIFV
ncbi:ABC transporter [Gordonibacter sp. 28C]|uniref:ABC transporter ATP-binding protein n=1 Tax=Gordonibacter sp. 28C TaxID=2078569 RepID=UPI000DF7CC92|nr:ABC transporter ATP-binding protein [Gordonibacter sp. 28C]RDB59887.1 ABC transporter [Gordonibacter sp. 28C]